MPYSKMKQAILSILKSEGFIKDMIVAETEGKKTLKVILSYDKTPSHIKQISKPGQRIYTKCKDIPRPLRGFGLIIISTPNGVVSGKTAAKLGVGGELICEIW